MTKQKLLYIITKSQFGGAQRYVYELAENLKNDFDVSVVCGGSGELIHKLHQARIETIPLRHIVRDMGIMQEVRAFLEMKRVIADIQPDIVHLNSSKAGVLGAVAARMVGVPHIIFTAHGWPFLERRNILWKAVAWAGSWVTALLAHTVIVVSKYDKEQARMPFISPLRVIHTAVPHVTFLPRPSARLSLFTSELVQKHRDALWLGTIAELTPNKNIFTAIDAVEMYNKTHTDTIFYTIVGSGELGEKLTQYIEDKDLGEYVRLTGYVDDARKYLAAFDMFLLPSKKEGFPYVLLEAGSAGLPVLASRVGGIPELIQNNRTGLLIDPDNVKNIVAAFDIYAADPALREKHAAALIERIENHHALPVMIEKTKRLYS